MTKPLTIIGEGPKAEAILKKVLKSGKKAELISHQEAEERGIKNKDLQEVKLEDPISKDEKKVGRNEPCFCKSGKKYKNCCLDK